MKTERPAKIAITYGCYPVDLQPSNLDTHDCRGTFGGKIMPLVLLPLHLLFAATEVTVKTCHWRTYDVMYYIREVQTPQKSNLYLLT